MMTQEETNDKKKKKKFSRRKFLVRTGTGLGVIMGVGYLTKPMWQRSIAGLANSLEPSYIGQGISAPLWFNITPSNEVILYSPKVEMGQGTFTGLAQIAADELEIELSRLQVKHAPTASGNIDGFSTGGSTSISSLWMPLRELAATMREMLKMEAAKLLEVDIAKLSVRNGVITSGDKSISFGQIASQVTEWTIPEVPPLKDVRSYKFIGKPIPRIDLKDKVMGAPIFGLDATMPGMLYGAVVRPSQIGAKYIDADTSRAESMPGVIQIVKEKDFVGVVARTRMEAELAKNAIDVEWEIERDWTTQDIEEMIQVGAGTAYVIQKEGKAKRIIKNADNVVKAEFKSPIGAHAQLEPNGAVALVEDGKATVMISTQVTKYTRDEVAKRLGIDAENVNVIPMYLGGGFGRRLHTPNAMHAAVLSRAVGKPVKCFFNRKEEFQNDTFRPPTHHVLNATIDDNGMIEAIEHHVSSGDVLYGSPMVPGIMPSILGADVGAWRGGMIQYSGIPNYRAISWRVKLPFATSFWRSLGLLANTFAIESFMDELALKAGKDPVQFRLDQINDDKRGFRLKEVIKAAAAKANYSEKIIDGRAMGFAASTDANTPCAQVAEVSIVDGEIKVHKVTCAMDPGISVNPDQVRAQCEGSIIMGMSVSMFEKMDVVDSELNPTNYGVYEMALMKDSPKEIDVVLLQNDDKPGAVGEPPLGPIAAAVANAVFRLTGERLRSLPLSLKS